MRRCHQRGAMPSIPPSPCLTCQRMLMRPLLASTQLLQWADRPHAFWMPRLWPANAAAARACHDRVQLRSLELRSLQRPPLGCPVLVIQSRHESRLRLQAHGAHIHVVALLLALAPPAGIGTRNTVQMGMHARSFQCRQHINVSSLRGWWACMPSRHLSDPTSLMLLSEQNTY